MSGTYPKPTSGISCPLLSLTVGEGMFASDLKRMEMESKIPNPKSQIQIRNQGQDVLDLMEKINN